VIGVDTLDVTSDARAFIGAVPTEPRWGPQRMVEAGFAGHGREHRQREEVVMEPDHGRVRAPTDGRGERDDSVPTLLLVTLAAVLAAVIGVVAISQVPTTSMLLVALIVALLGVVAVSATIGRQLADDDGGTSPCDAPAPASVIDGPERSPGRRDDDDARLAA